MVIGMYMSALIALVRSSLGVTYSRRQGFSTLPRRVQIMPLLVQLEGIQEHRKKSHFPQYEIMWERHQALPEVIAKSWAKNKPTRNLGSVATSLGKVMADLKQWSNANFGNVLKEIEQLRTQLSELELAGADRAQIRSNMNQLDEMLYMEEMLWLQRSRITWLKEGEHNTQYLHQRAIWRARRNYIQRLMKADDSWCNVPTEMEMLATSYFKEVYTKDPTLAAGGVLECITPKVTVEMNESLCKPFSEKEISDALFQTGPLKAPGCDGFPAQFYQRMGSAQN
ncbi:uncharacterized protein [Aegilops tauschii subsp. strangulata]|uniref:uncharacterized protein n=1 Tax=Aegilops tauschii subsp. strangulata TaxID=200361 RepID=UPI003CC85353